MQVAPQVPGSTGVTGGRPFAKGHGTENDFVLLLDPDDTDGLTPAQVIALCDRRAGLGADGVLRAVRAAQVPAWPGSGVDHPEGLWFMDYRNADGSVAEMCGNGIRVFVHYLIEQHQVRPDDDGRIVVATRAGLRTAWVLPTGRVRVAMGGVEVGPRDVEVRAGTSTTTAFRADVGNPHAVSFVPAVADVDLLRPPSWSPVEAFPDGVNLEFVQRVGPRHLAMRVYERGSGETRSCGTGTCAVAAVAALEAGDTERPVTYRVDVPGGSVEVELAHDETYLTGPATIVAHGWTGLV
ncbi:MAG: diaminopimelate epimerase [Propionibacteriaceae bacterium]